MRIGFLVPEFPSQTHAFFWREVQALRELGHHVTLLSTRRVPDDACKHEFAAEARAETRYLFPPRYGQAARTMLKGAPAMAIAGYVARCKPETAKDAAEIFALGLCSIDLLQVCRDEKLDHVHVHSCANAAHLAAMMYALGGPPYSLTLHGNLDVYGKYHAAKMRDAAFVSAVTRPLQKEIVDEIGLPESRVPVIWMGVDTRRFAPLEGVPERVASEPLRLVTVARLNVVKGHKYALQAVRGVLDAGLPVHYDIAGAGPEQANIEHEIERLGLTEHVTLHGTIAEGAVLDLLRRSHALVLSSFGHGEAAPVAVMEAMACGLPVICSIIGGTRDMIRDGEDGLLVEQHDVDGLERAIASLARDPALCRRLGQAARARSVEQFNFHVTSAQRVREMEAAR